jgi:general secretion pathway protein L
MAPTERLNSILKGLAPGSRSALENGELRDQLLDCLPKALRQVLAKQRRVLLIQPEGERARLQLVTGLATEELGEIHLKDSPELPPSLTAPGQEPPRNRELRLPRAVVLTRFVSFPQQVRSNLAQVIRYELDRLTPFQADEVVYDVRPQTGSKAANRLNLELAVCRRDLIDGWIKRLAELGAPIDRVTWPGAWPGANLLPLEQRPRARGLKLDLEVLAPLAAAILAVAVLVTPLWQKQHKAEALEGELGVLRKQAVAVDELRQELERARQGSTQVLQMKLDQPNLLRMLRDLTDRLPEDTWIQNLEVDGDLVDLRGESSQATALIATLEQAEGIDGVSFKSPITQVARTGKERFNIGFRYSGPSAP